MATTITKTEKLVGKRIRRREDPRLITGTATYVDDIKMPGMLYASIVRSPHAAAKIRSIDISKAAAAEGRGRGLRRRGHGRTSGRCPAALRCRGCASRIITFWRSIASIFVGHPVAVVVATDRYIARDARGSDRSRLRRRCRRWPIPRRRSRRARLPCIREWPDNVAFTFHQEGGDVEKAFEEADVVVKQRIISQRLIPDRHGNARRGGGVARGGPAA